MSVILKDSLAKIAISKNLIKEYKTSDCERTVYLNNGTEFQIYLKNPYQNHLGIKIYVNDKSIGNMIVLRPGQSHWLDRFVDNDSKLLFSTYEVENSAEMKYATSKNGKVRIEFYHEKEYYPYSTICTYNDDLKIKTPLDYPYSTICCATNSTYVDNSNTELKGCIDKSLLNLTTSATATANAMYSAKGIDIDKTATKAIADTTIETGRIEKGGKSNQEFEICDINFEYSSFKTENIQILPSSRKQVRAEDTRRKYCSQCGKKVSPKDKFCSNCGAKL